MVDISRRQHAREGESGWHARLPNEIAHFPRRFQFLLHEGSSDQVHELSLLPFLAISGFSHVHPVILAAAISNMNKSMVLVPRHTSCTYNHLWKNPHGTLIGAQNAHR
jgi:hypothetical protein